jgi:hypothetical protein
MFPTNIMANAFSFKPFEFFEAEEADKQNVKVKFD